jgi:hypothetical protein
MTGAVRSTLAVLLAAALLGAAAPAVDRARDERAAARLATEADDIANAVRRLAGRNSAAASGREGGTRQFLTVRVPARGTLLVRGAGAGSNRTSRTSALAWRVDGGPWHDRPPDDEWSGRSLAVRVPDGGLRLGPGRHRLRLSLARGPQRAVRIARAR